MDKSGPAGGMMIRRTDSVKQGVHSHVSGDLPTFVAPKFVFMQKATVGSNVALRVFIIIILLVVTPAEAGSMTPGPDIMSNTADTLLLSAGNFSTDTVMQWRDLMPEPSYKLSRNDTCFRYAGLFLPEESGNTKVDGYCARVLPTGEILSYAEVTDASAPYSETDAFRARADSWLYKETDAEEREMQQQFHSMISFFDGFRELARHTTVRSYPGVGNVTATTVFYHYTNDGDFNHEYFSIGSRIVKSTEEDSSGGYKWKNTGFGVHYNFTATCGDIPSFRKSSTTCDPQTSPRYVHVRGDYFGEFLHLFDPFGYLTGVFGQSITRHIGHLPDQEETFWCMNAGYCSDWATKPVTFFPVSEISGMQPEGNGTGWQVLGQTGIDMEEGWSRVGWSGYETAPESPDIWGHSLLIRTEAGETGQSDQSN